MNASVKISISRKNLLKMLSTYYSEQLNETVDVIANTKSVLKGYGLSEYTENEVDFSYTKNQNISGIDSKLTVQLTKDDIKEALNEILGKINYNVESLEFIFKNKYYGFYENDSETCFEELLVYVSRKKYSVKKLNRRKK